MRLVIRLLCPLLLATSDQAAGQWGFDLDEEREWTASISLARVEHELEGDVLWGEGVGNTSLDVESALDLEGSRALAGWIELQPGANVLLRAGFVPHDFSGRNVLTASEVVDGITYGIGDTVDTAFEFDSYELAFGYKFRIGRHLMVAPLLEVDLFDGFLDTVDLDIPGSAVSEEFIVPVPLAGLRVELHPLSRLGLFAEGKGFRAGNWGEVAEATIFDVEAGATLHLSRNLVLTAAYGATRFRFDISDTEIDLEKSGLRVGLDVRF